MANNKQSLGKLYQRRATRRDRSTIFETIGCSKLCHFWEHTEVLVEQEGASQTVMAPAWSIDGRKAMISTYWKVLRVKIYRTQMNQLILTHQQLEILDQQRRTSHVGPYFLKVSVLSLLVKFSLPVRLLPKWSRIFEVSQKSMLRGLYLGTCRLLRDSALVWITMSTSMPTTRSISKNRRLLTSLKIDQSKTFKSKEQQKEWWLKKKNWD